MGLRSVGLLGFLDWWPGVSADTIRVVRLDMSALFLSKRFGVNRQSYVAVTHPLAVLVALLRLMSLRLSLRLALLLPLSEQVATSESPSESSRTGVVRTLGLVLLLLLLLVVLLGLKLLGSGLRQRSVLVKASEPAKALWLLLSLLCLRLLLVLLRVLVLICCHLSLKCLLVGLSGSWCGVRRCCRLRLSSCL